MLKKSEKNKTEGANRVSGTKGTTRVWSALLPLLFWGIICCGKNQGGAQSPPPVIPPNPDSSQPGGPSDITWWLTRADRSTLLQKQTKNLSFAASGNTNPTILVDSSTAYQPIDGFGYTLTGGSASLIKRLPDASRAALLRELFSTDSGSIGISYLRVSIGASDLSASVFSYDDQGTPAQPDTTLQHFSLSEDLTDLVPLLKEILILNPSLKILGSPWSAPLWMKTNNSSKGGALLPAYYGCYARYLVKYIQAMKAEGITIDAITPQNEPMNPDNNPSMTMNAAEQSAFIRDYLGPAFQAAGLSTKIIVFDHNCDHPEYPLAVLADPGASQYIDGSAFHLYGGDIGALSQVYNAYPSKNIYFTEQWVGGPGDFGGDLRWHIKNLIIGAPRNRSRTVLEWNLASDPNYEPHTPGGCTNCQGALTISPAAGSGAINRNVSYYIIGHAAKFVRPGSVRIDSNIPDNLPNAAFRTPDGKKILIVLNDGQSTQNFNIGYKGKKIAAVLEAGSVATYSW